jgi:hypothetical protein
MVGLVVLGLVGAAVVASLALRDTNEGERDGIDLIELAEETFRGSTVAYTGDDGWVSLTMSDPSSQDYRALIAFVEELDLIGAIGPRMSTAEMLDEPRAAESDLASARWRVTGDGDLLFEVVSKR